MLPILTHDHTDDDILIELVQGCAAMSLFVMLKDIRLVTLYLLYFVRLFFLFSCFLLFLCFLLHLYYFLIGLRFGLNLFLDFNLYAYLQLFISLFHLINFFLLLLPLFICFHFCYFVQFLQLDELCVVIIEAEILISN